MAANVLRFALRWGLLVFALGLTACGGRAEIYDSLERCLEAEVCTCVAGSDCPRGLRCINGRCAEPDSVRGTGQLGDLCELGAECSSGICLPAGDGNHLRCSAPCGEGCPDGWRCTPDPTVPNGDEVCVQDQLRLCAACTEDLACGVAGDGVCMTTGPLAGTCARDCSLTPCPDGYQCAPLGTGEIVCLPAANDCGCGAASVGLSVACTTVNDLGTCWGQSVCGPGGAFGACDARAATAEVCNGIDDDCDGLLDDEDPDVDRTGLPAEPAFPACQVGESESCRGTWRCDVAAGWICEPAAPAEEICDGLDNDCDGTADQTFLDDQGRYTTPEHCGGCNRACSTLIPDLRLTPEGEVDPGAVACELRADAPTCVPLACAPGFAPWPEDAPVTCTPAATVQCMACVDATDCQWSTHRCEQLGTDSSAVCLQGCGVDAPAPGCTGQLGARGCCPEGHTCRERAGAPVCVPDGDGCECNSDRIGVKRPCLRPGDGGAQCAGEQTCGTFGGTVTWSSCDAAEVTREVCNGLDDDCNGRIDDDFLNTQNSGTYDTDEHCGQCYSSCLSLPNARGACDPAEGPGCVIAQCLPGQVPGGAFCADDAGCPSGYGCDPQIFQCVRRCGAGCQGGDLCVGGFCTATCTNDATCAARYGPESTCEGGVCAAAYQYVDLDESVSNGCECPVLAAGVIDTPDTYPSFPAAGAAYVDRDCDGVDGVVARSLFVRAGAAGNGSRERPFGTIADAVAAYVPARHDAILVAAGLYPETLALAEGVNLYGGYGPDFSERDIAGRPTILAPPEPPPGGPPAVVEARGIRGSATLSGFVVQGWDVSPAVAPGASGDNSVAVLIVDSGPGLVLVNNLLRGGRGGDGAPGRAGQAGAVGPAGSAGRDARECSSASCAGEAHSGGAPGVNSSCNGANGSQGGSANGNRDEQDYRPPLGKNGRGGRNAIYSSANNPQFSNLCKYDCTILGELEGGDAANGDPGTDGVRGDGCQSTLGRLVGEDWGAAPSGSGGAGQPGRGGGGGGAGGGVSNQNPATCTVGNRVGDLGSTGGGGGAGGCSGSGGGSGGGGGASFGIFLVRSAGGEPQILGNRVVRGAGGDGGGGGTGANGGEGGQGGAGGASAPPAWCAGGGGKGGRGGDGGRGGGGGGGCGGVAFGVAGRLQSAAALVAANDFTTDTLGGGGGRGGAGGRSAAGPAADGTAGLEGDAGDVQNF